MEKDERKVFETWQSIQEAHSSCCSVDETSEQNPYCVAQTILFDDVHDDVVVVVDDDDDVQGERFVIGVAFPRMKKDDRLGLCGLRVQESTESTLLHQ